MKLLDEPMSRDKIALATDMIEGSICRVCVSDNAEEIVAQLGFAVDRLSMIAYSRIKELLNKEEK